MLDPESYHRAYIILHRGVSLVQLDKEVVTSPVVIGKTVIVFVVPVEVHIAVPVPVGGILPVCKDILECEEIAPGVIEHPVKDHLYTIVMAGLHKFTEILICPEP